MRKLIVVLVFKSIANGNNKVNLKIKILSLLAETSIATRLS